MRRIAVFCLACAVCLAMLPMARGESEYPPFQGIVADMAGVLGEQTIEDLKTLAERAESQGLGKLYVHTRHFLGGADAAEYAQRVFEGWSLQENDALLLLVIGEESYALALGSAARVFLPAESQTSLLANHFRSAYLERKYDQATADLAVSLEQMTARSLGQTLDVSGLFGRAAIQSTPQPQSIDSIWQGMFAQDDYQEDPWNWDNEWEYEETHINWRGIFIWALVIYFLFFRRKKRAGRR